MLPAATGGPDMKRREFATLFGVAMAKLLPAARAWQLALPLVGYLNPHLKFKGEPVEAAFRLDCRPGLAFRIACGA